MPSIKQRWGKLSKAQKIGVGVGGAALLGGAIYGATKLFKKKGSGKKRHHKGANYWFNKYEAAKWKKRYYKLRYSR